MYAECIEDASDADEDQWEDDDTKSGEPDSATDGTRDGNANRWNDDEMMSGDTMIELEFNEDEFRLMMKNAMILSASAFAFANLVIL
jgi:hypothetical protein